MEVVAVVEDHLLEDSPRGGTENPDVGSPIGSVASAKIVTFRDELSRWYSLAWPVCLTNLCRTGMSLTDIAVLGHYDSKYLAPAGIATVWCSMSFVIINQGATAASGTLCSQAWGAKNFQLVGIWYHLGLVMALGLCIPVGALWCFAGNFFQPIVGIDDWTKDQVNIFARSVVFGLPFLTAYSCMNRWLQCQNVVYPQLFANLVCLMLNVGLNFLFVYGIGSWDGLGYVGSPIATSTSRFLQVCFLYLYAYKIKGIHTKTVKDSAYQMREVLRGTRVKEYLKLAIPLGLSGTLEDWQLQVISIFATRLGTSEIATHNAIFQCFWFLSSFMWAITDATRVRMSQHLGHGDPTAAKRVLKVACSASLMVAMAVATIFIAGSKEIGHIYSNDPQVWKLTQDISTLVGVGYSALSIFYVCISTLAAQGRAHLIAMSFLIGGWFVGVPASNLFAFHVDATKGLVGLWLGMSLGYGIVTLLALYFVVTGSWVTAALQARTAQEVNQTNSPTTNIGEEENELEYPLLDPMLDGSTLDPLGD